MRLLKNEHLTERIFLGKLNACACIIRKAMTPALQFYNKEEAIFENTVLYCSAHSRLVFKS